MSTNKVAPPPASSDPLSAAPPPAAAKTSPVRLIVLLAILAAAIGALGYDLKVAGPGCEAAKDTIEKFVDERNKKGVKEGSLVTAEDIRKEIGKEPTKIENSDEHRYTVEYYCWWGGVPLLNLRRHYISVVYTGDKPRHFSSYHVNGAPPSEALPIPEKAPAPSEGDKALPEPDSAGGGEGTPPEGTPVEGKSAEVAAPAEGAPAKEAPAAEGKSAPEGEKQSPAPPAEQKAPEKN